MFRKAKWPCSIKDFKVTGQHIQNYSSALLQALGTFFFKLTSARAKSFCMNFTQSSCDFHLNWANDLCERVHVKFKLLNLSLEIHDNWISLENQVNFKWISRQQQLPVYQLPNCFFWVFFTTNYLVNPPEIG